MAKSKGENTFYLDELLENPARLTEAIENDGKRDWVAHSTPLHNLVRIIEDGHLISRSGLLLRGNGLSNVQVVGRQKYNPYRLLCISFDDNSIFHYSYSRARPEDLPCFQDFSFPYEQYEYRYGTREGSFILFPKHVLGSKLINDKDICVDGGEICAVPPLYSKTGPEKFLAYLQQLSDYLRYVESDFGARDQINKFIKSEHIEEEDIITRVPISNGILFIPFNRRQYITRFKDEIRKSGVQPKMTIFFTDDLSSNLDLALNKNPKNRELQRAYLSTYGLDRLQDALYK